MEALTPINRRSARHLRPPLSQQRPFINGTAPRSERRGMHQGLIRFVHTCRCSAVRPGRRESSVVILDFFSA